MKATSLVAVCVLALGLQLERVKGAVGDIGKGGPKAQRCQLPLGMEDGRITDYQITASSNSSSKSAARRGRLDTRKDENGYGAWSSNNSKSGWLQVDLGDVSIVTKVGTQGRQDADQWVKTFYLKYSIDGIHWAEFKDTQSRRKIFSGNSDRNTVVTNTLKPPIYARYVRFVVDTEHGHASMRTEVYGCRNVKSCNIPLGLEDKRIPDTAITASYHEGHRLPRYARLNYDNACCGDQEDGEYIQVDLGEVKVITGIATQGFPHGSYWVTRYYLEHSIDGMHWAFYYEPTTEKKGGNISG